MFSFGAISGRLHLFLVVKRSGVAGYSPSKTLSFQSTDSVMFRVRSGRTLARSSWDSISRSISSSATRRWVTDPSAS